MDYRSSALVSVPVPGHKSIVSIAWRNICICGWHSWIILSGRWQVFTLWSRRTIVVVAVVRFVLLWVWQAIRVRWIEWSIRVWSATWVAISVAIRSAAWVATVSVAITAIWSATWITFAISVSIVVSSAWNNWQLWKMRSLWTTRMRTTVSIKSNGIKLRSLPVAGTHFHRQCSSPCTKRHRVPCMSMSLEHFESRCQCLCSSLLLVPQP